MKKRVFTIFTASFALSALILIPVLSWGRLFNPPEQLSPRAEYRGIIELWHIETFEGGAYSRAAWLGKQALAYERTHKGTFVHVSTLTLAQASEKLAAGGRFDLLSFSFGAGEIFLEQLAEFCGSVNTRADLISAAEVGGKLFALPYLVGGYLLAAEEKNLPKTPEFAGLIGGIFDCAYTKKIGKNTVRVQSVMCGYGEFNLPLMPVALKCPAAKSFADAAGLSDGMTQFEAYDAFIRGGTGAAAILLGTQRDLIRLSAKESSGALTKFTYAFFEGFTDLVQYIGISQNAAADAEKLDVCTDFAEYLTSDTVQLRIADLQMFSACGIKLYADGHFAAMERALEKPLQTPKLFESREKLLALRNQIHSAVLTGDKKGLLG